MPGFPFCSPPLSGVVTSGDHERDRISLTARTRRLSFPRLTLTPLSDPLISLDFLAAI